MSPEMNFGNPDAEKMTNIVTYQKEKEKEKMTNIVIALAVTFTSIINILSHIICNPLFNFFSLSVGFELSIHSCSLYLHSNSS